MFLSLFLLAGLSCADLHSGLSEPVVDSLHAVTVTADRGVIVSRADTLNVGNSISITDVLQQSTSLYVGDNGGWAGLKTISLRGLGSAHTSICIDGVKVGNVQSGQADIGMLGLDNYESIVVDYAQNQVSFRTARPEFGSLPLSGRVRMEAGSFGTYMPSARFDFRLSDNLSLSANASGTISKGNYECADGLRRVNNDFRQVRAGLDLFGLLHAGDYHVKAWFNGSERGTPGSVDWPSEDRQKDRNAFVQGVLRKSFTPLYTLMVSAKGAYDDISYTSSWGDSRYGQTELQLNSSHDFRIADWCRISLAADLRWDALKSTGYEAARLGVSSAVASSFRTGRFAADAAVEFSGAFDEGADPRMAFSPSVDLRYNVLEGLDIHAFGRRAYRIPTFNELYYVGYGNPLLRPEDAWLADLGTEYFLNIGKSWTVKAGIDGFVTLLENKIISAPSEADPNIWQPYNVGKSRSTGVDATAGFAHKGDWEYSVDAKYSFQSSVDLTPDSFTYGEQLPYVSRHSLLFNGTISFKGWSLNPVWNLRSGRSDATGEMPDWSTLDATFSKSMPVREVGILMLRISVRNITDTRYESVRGYPMPGRSITGGIDFKF